MRLVLAPVAEPCRVLVGVEVRRRSGRAMGELSLDRAGAALCSTGRSRRTWQVPS